MNIARLKASAVAMLSLLGMIVLYNFPPSEYNVYPACLIHRYLHVYCPGCGATRALAALLHGRIADAIHYNLVFVALLPMLLALALSAYWSAMTTGEVRWPQLPKPALVLLVAAVATFGVARNF